MVAWPRDHGDPVECHRDYLLSSALQGSLEEWIETVESVDLSDTVRELERLAAAPFCTLARRGEAPSQFEGMRDEMCSQFVTMGDVFYRIREMGPGRATKRWGPLVRTYWPDDAAFVRG